MTKKLLCIALALIMMFGSVSVAANAATRYTPTILIPGIFMCETFLYDEDGNVVRGDDGQPLAQPFYIDSVDKILPKALEKALAPVANMLASQDVKDRAAAEAIGDVVGEMLLEKTKCDENGQKINDFHATYYAGSFDELTPHDQEWILKEFPITYGVNKVGGEYFYVFSFASLDNMIQVAHDLYDYIQFVKQHSGSSKVNIVPISQGGSIANALMQLYKEMGVPMSRDINRMLFLVPALDGSALLGNIYKTGILDDSYNLYNTMMPYLFEELLGSDASVGYLISLILRIMPEANVNAILDEVVDTMIDDYMSYCTELWGLIPSADYPELREKYLDEPEKAEIRRQTDWFYQAQLDSDANILQAVEDGVKVFDIVDYNMPLYQLCDDWDTIQADGIIHVDGTSMGAFSLGRDVKLPADYKPAVNNCHNPKHDHTDPHGIIDPRTGLLPDTTFYFYKQAHAATGGNDVIIKLLCDLATDESFVDVYSYPDKYPQFNEGRDLPPIQRKLDQLKSYDLSGMDDATKQDVNDAIAQTEALFATTIIKQEETEAAVAHLDEAIARVENGGTVPEEKPTAKGVFGVILKFLSFLYYWLWGGKGIGEVIGWPEIYGEIQAKDAVTKSLKN